jgi:hypothetical protein
VYFAYSVTLQASLTQDKVTRGFFFCFQAGAHLDLNVVVMVQKAFTDDDCQEFMEQQQPIFDDKNGHCPKWHKNCAIHKFIKEIVNFSKLSSTEMLPKHSIQSGSWLQQCKA